MMSCGSKPLDPLPPVPEDFLTSILTCDKTDLTTDNSTTVKEVSVASEENSEISFTFELGVPCYRNEKGNVPQIGVRPGSYIKAKSNYYIDRIVVDGYVKKMPYKIYNSVEMTSAISYHETGETSMDASEANAKVYSYEIKSNFFTIVNDDEYGTGTFYAIKVIYKNS